MEALNIQAEKEAKKKIDLLRGHSFKIICTSLIKLLDNGKSMYEENKLELSYVQYMGIVNIFSDELPKLKNYNRTIPEYSILINELNAAYDIIVEIKKKLQEKEKNNQKFEKFPSQQNLGQTNYSPEESSVEPLPEESSMPPFPASKARSIPGPNSVPIKPPKPIHMKTIPPQAVFKYLTRIVSGEEQNPPQILLIDIREPNDYHSGHIYWKNNSNLNYNGVINIPMNLFFIANMDIKRLILEAENLEINEGKKTLIRNICYSDLIIFYDFCSNIVDEEFHRIIPDTLFNNNNGMKIKRPPVMLENGYNGWVQFLNDSGKKISDWVDISESNNSID